MLAGLTEGQGLGSGHGQGLGSGHGGSRMSTPSARLLTHLEGNKFNGEYEASDESEKIPSDDPVPPPPPHILIVDDSQLCQKIVKKILTSCDYTYETAFNGQEAVEKLGNIKKKKVEYYLPPFCILTDIHAHVPYTQSSFLLIPFPPLSFSPLPFPLV